MSGTDAGRSRMITGIIPRDNRISMVTFDESGYIGSDSIVREYPDFILNFDYIEYLQDLCQDYKRSGNLVCLETQGCITHQHFEICNEAARQSMPLTLVPYDVWRWYVRRNDIRDLCEKTSGEPDFLREICEAMVFTWVCQSLNEKGELPCLTPIPE